LSAESTVGEELEGVVSSAIHVSIDSQSTLVTLERLRKAEIGVPSTAVAARFGQPDSTARSVTMTLPSRYAAF
jgi:hypothetical protein